MSDASVENTTTSGTETTPLSLAKRLVNCKHFRWLPGMLAIRWTGPCRGSHRYTDAEVRAGVTFHRGTPDLTDPATLGCLLALVRRVRPYACVEYCGGYWRVVDPEDERWDTDRGFGPWCSEAEALVAALEAAP